jgi:hypothetical protein
MLNRSALNQADINGAREIFADGSAAVDVAASGDLSLGLSLSGGADLSLSVSGTLNARLQGSGELAEIALTGDWPPMVRVPLSGSLQTSIESDITDPYLRMRPELPADIALQAEGDGKAVPPAPATFNLQTFAGLDGEVITPIQGEGSAQLSILAGGLLSDRRVIQAGGRAVSFLSGWAVATLTMMAPFGVGEVTVNAQGDSRKGGRLRGSGRVRIDFLARGYGHLWHHVRAEGRPAIIRLSATDKTAGVPDIPANYQPAPENRTFYVIPDQREFRVAGSRRTV